MLKREFALLFLSAAFLVVGACNDNKNPEFNGEPTSKTAKVLPQQVKAVFQAKCTPCHTSAGGAQPNWLDYSTVVSKKDLIKSRAIENTDPTRSMPPAGMPGLTPEEKKILLDWFAAGAPGEKPSPAPAPAPVPGPSPAPTSTDTEELPPQIKQVFEAKCTPCHTVQDGPLPYWLSYKIVFDKKDLIKSRAIDIVDPEKPMPPSGMPALTDEEKKLLSDWIASGAPPATKNSTEN